MGVPGQGGAWFRGCLVWRSAWSGGWGTWSWRGLLLGAAWSQGGLLPVGGLLWGMPGPGDTWSRPLGTATAVAIPILLECIHVNQCVYAHSFRRRGIKTKLITPYGFIFKLVHYKHEMIGICQTFHRNFELSGTSN